MKREKLFAELALYTLSHNSVPVERCTIKVKELEEILGWAANAREALEAIRDDYIGNGHLAQKVLNQLQEEI